MIYAKMILHSKTHDGRELISIETYQPYFLDAEIEKHGMLSSNSSSNRAIPFNKMVNSDFFIPEDVRLNEKGMQGFERLLGEDLEIFAEIVKEMRADVLSKLNYLHATLDIHKQHLNRYIAPWSMQKKILTATRESWDGVMMLRNHEAADPAVQIWAKVIQALLDQPDPRIIQDDEWHLPYLTEADMNLSLLEKLKVSSARCARTSYEDFDKKPSTYAKDSALFHDKLVGGDVVHATPLTHQGKPTEVNYDTEHPDWEVGVTHMMKDGQFGSGNFTGWVQFRHWYDQTKFKPHTGV